MSSTKIVLSPAELDLARNAGIILTKNAVMKKTWLMLESVQETITGHLQQQSSLPGELVNTTAKISKGENYRGLPYLVLDYPRFFSKDDTFAIRCMFWWGHFFSITLQLSGRFQSGYSSQLGNAFRRLAGRDYHICVSEDPWEHHFEPAYYKSLGQVKEKGFNEIIAMHPFVKLAAKFPIDDWAIMHNKLREEFEMLVKLLS